MRGQALIGVSGWSYPHWNGRFYPPGLPTDSRLAYLAQRFGTVEINATFYHLERPQTFSRWRAAVPPGFIFAVKGSRYITHLLKLDRCQAPLANFFAQGLLLLGEQLGPILWQLPPGLRFDAARAERFFSRLPLDLAAAERLARRHDARVTGRCVLTAPSGRSQRLRHACEIRHPSWLSEEALRLLQAYDVALVTADTARRHPLSRLRTASFAYLRLHGARELYASRYTDDELTDWATLVEQFTARGDAAFVYFDNDAKAHAPHDAARFRARVEVLEHSGRLDARP